MMSAQDEVLLTMVLAVRPLNNMPVMAKLPMAQVDVCLWSSIVAVWRGCPVASEICHVFVTTESK